MRSSYEIGPKFATVIKGKSRIFDGLNDVAVSEVKNVRRQALTAQIRDYLSYAQDKQLRLDLYVRDGTDITGPLLRASQNPELRLSIIRGLHD
jgi:hypothetical protein